MNTVTLKRKINKELDALHFLTKGDNSSSVEYRQICVEIGLVKGQLCIYRDMAKAKGLVAEAKQIIEIVGDGI